MKKTRILTITLCVLVFTLAFAVCAYGTTVTKYGAYKTGQVNAGDVNVRADASEDAAVLGSVSKGVKVTLTGYAYVEKTAEPEKELWYSISYNGKDGFIKSDYVKGVASTGYTIYTPYKKGIVKGKGTKVRKSYSTSSKKVGWLKKGKIVSLYGYRYNKGTKWYCISYNGKVSYVSGKNVKIYTGKASVSESKSTSKKKSASSKVSSSSKGKAIAKYALKYVGRTPYRYGGSSLKSGADCSGFVKAVYAHFGYKLPHNSWGIEKKGKSIGSKRIGNAKPGDIICTNGHVGIYIGNGKMVHARQPGERVRVDKVGYGKSTKYNGKSVRTIRRLAK